MDGVHFLLFPRSWVAVTLAPLGTLNDNYITSTAKGKKDFCYAGHENSAHWLTFAGILAIRLWSTSLSPIVKT